MSRVKVVGLSSKVIVGTFINRGQEWDTLVHELAKRLEKKEMKCQFWEIRLAPVVHLFQKLTKKRAD